MTNKPLVSAIIAVYNGARYVGEAIESVLTQTYQPVELIVVDDGSTDDTALVARRFDGALRYAFQPNAGVATALNHGIRLVHGSFVAILDADDYWSQDKLAKQTAAFETNPALNLVFGHVQQFRSPQETAPVSIARGPIPGYVKGTLLARREAFARVGNFATRWKTFGEFVDWYARATDLGLQSLMLPDVVLYRRLHADNTSVRERASLAELAHVMKATLDRRRAARR